MKLQKSQKIHLRILQRQLKEKQNYQNKDIYPQKKKSKLLMN